MSAPASLVRAETADMCWVQAVTELGFATAAAALPTSMYEVILKILELMAPAGGSRRRGGIRNLFTVVPEVRHLARSRALRDLVEPILGQRCFAVGATLFDKTPVTNWRVSWHQDLSVAVHEQRAVEDWGPWSKKAGVPYVQAPASILEAMLAVRVHLDSCGASDGCLRVIPGSHRLGRLSDEAIAAFRDANQSVECPVARGGVFLMRPLLLHSSSQAVEPRHRRVIHLEYAAADLPEGMKWHRRV